MSAKTFDVDLEYWGDRLEVPTDLVVQQHAQDDYMRNWVATLTRQSRAVLAEYFDIEPEVPLAEARDVIFARREYLLPFLLVQKAAFGKRTYAIAEVARAKLVPAALESCRIGDRDAREEHFDALALMWRLYLAAPANLEVVFLSDRAQRRGFADMVLDAAREWEGLDAATFFVHATLQAILDAYEADETTLRRSHCAAVLPDEDGGYRVFIKRDNEPSFVSHGPKNTFGFEREWIVLAFDEDLRRVRICSTSPKVPAALANRIAGQYFGEVVRYENETIESSSEAIERFLRRLLEDDPPTLPLVELVVKNCGLEGSPQLRLSSTENRSLAIAIAQFGQAFSDPMADIHDIESIKVFVFKKRVKMVFEPVEGVPASFVVRYADQPLNTSERREFEALMKRDYDLTVRSTEKRYAEK